MPDPCSAGPVAPLCYPLWLTQQEVILQRGFVPPNATVYQNLLHRAALTSLLLQSPAGEMPTGSRSSQHQWNEVGLAASLLSCSLICGWSPSCC